MNFTKRLMSSLLASGLTISLVTGSMPIQAAGGTPYSDVDESAYYMDGVKYLYDNKIMTGTTETTFSPDTNLSRGMVATILYRLEGSPNVTDTSFGDVPSWSYYYNASRWANAQNLMTGNEHTGSQNTFDGEDSIKRQDLALVLLRYAQYKKNNSHMFADLSDFNDEPDVSDYAYSGMQWAVANKIISGKYNGTVLDPLGKTSRAEAATMLERYLNTKTDDKTDPDNDENIGNGSESEEQKISVIPNLKDFHEAALSFHAYDGKLDTSKLPSSAQNLGYENGRLLVGIINGTLPDIQDYNPVSILRDNENYYIVQFNDALNAYNAAQYLQKQKNIEYIEVDQLNDPGFAEVAGTQSGSYASWGISPTHLDELNEYVKESGSKNSVTVAVIDTGVDVNHPFLTTLMKGTMSFKEGFSTSVGVGAYTVAGNWNEDSMGHGTSVTGVLVDALRGLNVRIMPIRTTWNMKGNYWTSDLKNSIKFARENGADVINMSLSGKHTEPIEKEVALCDQKGISVVVSSGNGDEDDIAEDLNKANLCPAHISSVITVGSVINERDESNVDWGSVEDPAHFDRTELDLILAPYSNYGASLDIVAPGSNMDVPEANTSGMIEKSGTSFATPHVTAAMAMLKLIDPIETTVNDASYKLYLLTQLLLDYGTQDMGAKGKDPYYGNGFLRVDGLVAKLKGESPEGSDPSEPDQKEPEGETGPTDPSEEDNGSDKDKDPDEEEKDKPSEENTNIIGKTFSNSEGYSIYFDVNPGGQPGRNDILVTLTLPQTGPEGLAGETTFTVYGFKDILKYEYGRGYSESGTLTGKNVQGSLLKFCKEKYGDEDIQITFEVEKTKDSYTFYLYSNKVNSGINVKFKAMNLS